MEQESATQKEPSALAVRIAAAYWGGMRPMPATHDDGLLAIDAEIAPLVEALEDARSYLVDASDTLWEPSHKGDREALLRAAARAGETLARVKGGQS